MNNRYLARTLDGLYTIHYLYTPGRSGNYSVKDPREPEPAVVEITEIYSRTGLSIEIPENDIEYDKLCEAVIEYHEGTVGSVHWSPR